MDVNKETLLQARQLGFQRLGATTGNGPLTQPIGLQDMNVPGVQDRLLLALLRQQQMTAAGQSAAMPAVGSFVQSPSTGVAVPVSTLPASGNTAALALLLHQQQLARQRSTDANQLAAFLALVENSLLGGATATSAPAPAPSSANMQQLLLNNLGPTAAVAPQCGLRGLSSPLAAARPPVVNAAPQPPPSMPLNLAVGCGDGARRHCDRPQMPPTPKFLYDGDNDAAPFAKTCSMCNSSFQTRRQYSAHLRVAHHSASVARCTQCGYATRSQVKLIKHKLRAHVASAGSVPVAVHEDSDASDDESLGNVTQQWQSVLAQRALAVGHCVLCEQPVTGGDHAAQHVATHVTPGKYMCYRCCLSSSSLAEIRQHVFSAHPPTSVPVCSVSAQTEPSWGDLEELGIQPRVQVDAEPSSSDAHMFRVCDQPLVKTESLPPAVVLPLQISTAPVPSAPGNAAYSAGHSQPKKKSPRGRRTYDTAKYPHLTLDGLVVERARQEATGAAVAPQAPVVDSLEPAAILNRRYLSEEDAIEGPTEEEQARFSADGEAALVSASGDGQPATGSDRVCGVCGYQGKWVSEMIRHRRVHTTERPFKCKYCTRTSKWKADLIRHVAKVHGIRVLSKYSRSRQTAFASKRAASEECKATAADGPSEEKRDRPCGLSKPAASEHGDQQAATSGDSACGSSVATGSTVSDVPVGSPDMSSVASSPSPKQRQQQLQQPPAQTAASAPACFFSPYSGADAVEHVQQQHVTNGETTANDDHPTAARDGPASDDGVSVEADASSSRLSVLLRAVAEHVARESEPTSSASESAGGSADVASSDGAAVPTSVITTSVLRRSPLAAGEPIDLAHWTELVAANDDYKHAGLEASTLPCTRLVFSEHVKLLAPHIPKVTPTAGDEPSAESLWRCRYCAHTSKRRANVAAHEYTHTRPGRDGRYRCPRCPLRAARADVNRHYLEQHLSPSERAAFLTEHVCVYCPAAFVSSADRDRHQTRHVAPPPSAAGPVEGAACARCLYRCADALELAAHNVVHALATAVGQ